MTDQRVVQHTIDPLRVLIANEQPDRLVAVASIIRGLGHDVTPTVIGVDDVAQTISLEHPDVALVGIGDSSEEALGLISRIVKEAECPVIAVLPTTDVAFVREAGRRGIFAYIVDADADSMQNAIEIVLLRFREYHGLQSAFGRRALTERAKGILMERYGIDERSAFELLRKHARQNNQKLVDIAQALITEHQLRPPG